MDNLLTYECFQLWRSMQQAPGSEGQEGGTLDPASALHHPQSHCILHRLEELISDIHGNNTQLGAD